MKQQLEHTIASSLVLWFDHTLLKEGEAFSNYGGKFFQMDDPKLAGYSVYSLPFGQIVSDSSVTGAAIPSGVYVNNVFVGRGTSGLHLDFQRGRAIFNPGHNNLNVSGNVAVKEFDVVFSVVPEDRLLISSNFSLKPKFSVASTGLGANEYQFPAIFISNQNSDEVPFEFGRHAGIHTTRFRALVLAENDWQLLGVGSIFSAKKHTYIPLLDTTPYDFFGDLKGSGYNYNSSTTGVSADHLMFVKECTFTKFSIRANLAVNALVTMGVVEMALEVVRI